MFGSQHRVNTVVISDPAGDDKIPVMVAPNDHSITVERVSVTLAKAVSGSTVNYIECSVENAGTAGTATLNLGGTAGGTAGWTANVPQAISITAGSGRLTAGQVLVLDYAETGTVDPDYVVVNVEYVDGLGVARNS